MNPIKWLKCLLRNYHRRLVPDMAFLFADDRNITWPGRCRDCGNVKRRTGRYWVSLPNGPKPPALGTKSQEGKERSRE